jgi:hypothetical protein
MSKGSISKNKNPTPEKGIRKMRNKKSRYVNRGNNENRGK